jgi:lysyl-tRNA synthetase class 2
MSDTDNVTEERDEQAPQPEETSHLIETRRAKAAELREQGINPYPYRFDRSHTVAQALEAFDTLSADETEITLAGRLMLKRDMGKSIFCDLRDQSGKIQIYAKLNELGEDPFKIFGKLDIGDIIGVRGTLFETRKGERTLKVSSFEVLCKSLHPLPDKHAGLSDIELRYRQRYVDLIVNPEVREVFETRTKIVSAVRDFLNGKGFLEVETPVLQPLYGGAAARPFVTHHNTLDTSLYLRIADELYLKRLIVGGFEKVWEYCKDFRNEGMSRFHNPEFTMVELYWAYADYHDMMDMAEELYRTVAEQALGTTTVTFEDHVMDFAKPFARITMVGSVAEATGVDLSDLSFEEAEAAAKKLGVEGEGLFNWGKIVEACFERFVEPKLSQPTFVMDFPVDISPLAKRHRENPRLTERWEVFLAGLECGNAFSELNDPDDQRDRFLQQVEAAQSGDEEAPNAYDTDYVTALQYGMPPTAGWGFGIDRMVMILTNQSSIRDVLLFPQLRPEVKS